MAINFPDAPTLNQVFQGYYWDGEKWMTQGSIAGAVRYDVAQGLSANQRSQARSNIGDLKKNYIINGAMMVSQENGTTAGTANGYYPVDIFNLAFSNAGTQTAQQVGVSTPGGSTYRLRVTATVADASVAAGDWCNIFHAVEGYRAADLITGVKTITIQFGVKAPAGTYVVNVQNAAQNRSYPATYVIAAGEANTDVVKSVTLTLDNTGTWLVDNSAGFYLSWSLMAGTTFQGTANTWQAGNKTGVAGQFNFMGTGGNIFELFDVSLTEGTVAPPFMVPDYASELQLCLRYWEKIGPQKDIFSGNVTSGQGYYKGTGFLVRKRATPTMVGIDVGSNLFTPGVGTINVDSDLGGFVESRTANATGAGYFQTTITANARL